MSGHKMQVLLRGAGKSYRIWANPSGRLKAPLMEAVGGSLPKSSPLRKHLLARAHRYFHDFWALRDVDLEVRRGESIGIIGRNGSGKSTLLQIIAGTLNPSVGEVQVDGRVAALLELGSGFNPEFSGRENVYLNAAVLGLTAQQIEARYPLIVEFAEIGEFIDQPVKTYSSGMQMRLAFAVAAHVDADILIIDEALGVGDARFQLKCSRAIDRFVAAGTTFLFVSHDLNAIKRLCTRAVLVEQGRIVYTGLPNDVANLYSKLIADGGSLEGIEADIESLRARHRLQPASADPNSAPKLPETARATKTKTAPLGDQQVELVRLRQRVVALEQLLSAAGTDPDWHRRVESMTSSEREQERQRDRAYVYGGERGRITHYRLCDAEDRPRSWFITGDTMRLHLIAETDLDLPEPILALTIKDPKGQEVYGTNTLFSRQPLRALRAGEAVHATFSLTVNLMPGEYIISLGFTHFVGAELVVVQRRYDTMTFTVHGKDRCFGIANCFAKITTEAPVSALPLASLGTGDADTGPALDAR